MTTHGMKLIANALHLLGTLVHILHAAVQALLQCGKHRRNLHGRYGTSQCLRPFLPEHTHGILRRLDQITLHLCKLVSNLLYLIFCFLYHPGSSCRNPLIFHLCKLCFNLLQFT